MEEVHDDILEGIMNADTLEDITDYEDEIGYPDDYLPSRRSTSGTGASIVAQPPPPSSQTHPAMIPRAGSSRKSFSHRQESNENSSFHARNNLKKEEDVPIISFNPISKPPLPNPTILEPEPDFSSTSSRSMLFDPDFKSYAPLESPKGKRKQAARSSSRYNFTFSRPELYPLSKPDSPNRFFIVHCAYFENVQISQHNEVWASVAPLTDILKAAYTKGTRLFLIVICDNMFRGYFQVDGVPGSVTFAEWYKIKKVADFSVKWQVMADFPVEFAWHLCFTDEERTPVYLLKDGQELPPLLAKSLMDLIEQYSTKTLEAVVGYSLEPDVLTRIVEEETEYKILSSGRTVQSRLSTYHETNYENHELDDRNGYFENCENTDTNGRRKIKIEMRKPRRPRKEGPRTRRSGEGTFTIEEWKTPEEAAWEVPDMIMAPVHSLINTEKVDLFQDYSGNIDLRAYR